MTILYFLKFAGFIAPLFWLAAVLAFWAKDRVIKSNLVKCGIISTIAIFIILDAYSSIITYNLWKNDPISRYLLPPYEEAYFYQYAYFHYWRGDLIALLASLGWAGLLAVISKYSQSRILDKSDAYLGFFTALAVGWPNFVIYLIFTFGLLLVYHIVNNLILKKTDRIAITASLIISAVIVMIWGKVFIDYFGLNVLRV